MQGPLCLLGHPFTATVLRPIVQPLGTVGGLPQLTYGELMWTTDARVDLVLQLCACCSTTHGRDDSTLDVEAGVSLTQLNIRLVGHTSIA